MKLIAANLFCFNPWQRAAIQHLLASTADLLILPEVKPALLHWLHATVGQQGYTLVTAQTNHQMALCVLSRRPIARSQLIDQGSFAGRPQLRVELVGGVTLFGIHLMAPITPRKHQERNAQLLQLTALIQAELQPVIAAGDFNTLYNEQVFQPLRQVAAQTTADTVPRPKSWPAFFPLASLDHVIHNQSVTLEQLTQGKFNGSDHLPVIARLSINC